ncbi:MAG TPA: hypothetical protein VGJ44_04670 [Kribbellaceae bacterium]|jgi:hypothetical protein
MRSRLPRLLPIGIAAVLLTVCTASNAAADGTRCTSDANCAGKVTFTSYGEVFKIYDQSADGHSAVGVYWLPDGSSHVMWNPNGNGSVVTVNLELAEGSWVTYRACLGEYGTKTLVSGSCGPTITDYA